MAMAREYSPVTGPLPGRLMVGRLVLAQVIQVRVLARQQYKNSIARDGHFVLLLIYIPPRKSERHPLFQQHINVNIIDTGQILHLHDIHPVLTRFQTGKI